MVNWQSALAALLQSELARLQAEYESLLRVELEQRLATENQSASEASPLDEAWWRSAPVGIFGERCDRSRVLVDGDRVEMYVALKVDPKAARRERAQPHQTEKGRNPLTRKPGR